jgi:4-hydroxy-tetrahydrodipicolinate synthase
MFSGAITALATPFKSNLEVDYDAFGRLIDFQLEHGINGLVPCGSTGEAATLSHDEQKQMVRFTVERVAGRVPVIAGTGSNNTQEAIDLTKFAAEVRCDGALMITPYYNKPMPQGLSAHYRAVAEAADIPIILYNIPGRTGVKMSPELIANLARVKNIVAVKEACGDVDMVSQILLRSDITVLSGDDGLTLPMMAVGATGVISVASNILPAEVTALCAAATAGEYDIARAMHYRLLPIFGTLFIETNPIPVKAALAAMGLIENHLRLPMTPISPAAFEKLKQVMRETGIQL